MIITQAKDPIEAYQLLDLAFDRVSSPFAIRYSNIPFQNFEYRDHYTYDAIELGTWEQLRDKGVLNLITYGDNVLRMAQLIDEYQLPINLYNARFIKPFDQAMVEKIALTNEKTWVLEDVTILGGLGSSILEYLHEKRINSNQFEILGLPDEYIEQGKVHEIYQQYHLDNESLFKRFIDALK